MSRRPFNPDCGMDIATTTIQEVKDLTDISYFGFRVVLHPDGVFFIHETYYGADESILGIARKPAEPCADTQPELETVLDDMRDALREPVLILSDIAGDD